jgi:hypothetical protein
MNIIDAIKEAHQSKRVSLDVKIHPFYATWDQDNDEGWQRYKKARDEIHKYELLEKLLEEMGII